MIFHSFGCVLGPLVTAVALLSAAAAQAGPLEETNKKIVLEFMEVVLNGRNADAAPKYVVDNFIQHNPRLPDGVAALQGFVRMLQQSAPQARSTVKRAVAEGDLVVLHSLNQRNPEDRGMAQVEIYRLENGKIAEHWDVFQPIQEFAVNSNGML